MTRETDHAWDALVEVTGADVGQERGALNAALGNIRRLTEELDVDGAELAIMIQHRATLYREVFPELPLTATALSKWWDKLQGESDRRRELASAKQAELEERKKTRGVNLSARSDCVTCGGDHWVIVRYREPQTTVWMSEHPTKYKRHPHDKGFEETAPCPVCNLNPPVMRNFWDGRDWAYSTEPGEVVLV